MKKRKTVGRPKGPLTAVAFEKELAALHRMQGHLTVRQFNEKYVALVTRFREGK